MLRAFDHPIGYVDLDEGFVVLIELGFVDTDHGPVIVHAMTARRRYLR